MCLASFQVPQLIQPQQGSGVEQGRPDPSTVERMPKVRMHSFRAKWHSILLPQGRVATAMPSADLEGCRCTWFYPGGTLPAGMLLACNCSATGAVMQRTLQAAEPFALGAGHEC